LPTALAVISHFPRRTVNSDLTTEHAPVALYLIFSPKLLAEGRALLLKALVVSGRANPPKLWTPRIKRMGKITVTGEAVELPALVTAMAHSPAPAKGVICRPFKAHAGASERYDNVAPALDTAATVDIVDIQELLVCEL